MKLQELFNGIPVRIPPHLLNQEVGRITFDTRQVKPGDLFVAIRGNRRDGHHYLAEALSRGAVAVLVEDPDFRMERSIVVEDSRTLLPDLAQRFYGYPSRNLELLGITGTNGKSTSAWILFHFLRRYEATVGLVGTIQTKINDTWFQNALTTPDPVFLAEFHRYLADLGGRTCVMEVSSHGIHQQRVKNLWFRTRIFTNLAPEHLDYHGTLEDYFLTKARWFQTDTEGAITIINADNPYGRQLAAMVPRPILTSLQDPNVQYRAADPVFTSSGVTFTVHYAGLGVRFKVPLLGLYNVQNLLQLIAALRERGHTLMEIAAGLEQIPQVPGRLEKLFLKNGALAVIDYAHTPDAYELLFTELQRLPHGRIITVFGAGGDRDRSKRPLLAAAVSRHSDYFYITDDNPRREAPEQIIADLVKGVQHENFAVIRDRREAILKAMEQLRENDLLLLLGKGHETYQIYGEEKQYFNEHEILAPYLE